MLFLALSVILGLGMVDSRHIPSTVLKNARDSYLFFIDCFFLTSNSQLNAVFVHTGTFLQFLRQFAVILIRVGPVVIIVSVLIYSVFVANDKLTSTGFKYKTHENQYTYLVSAAYVSGSVRTVDCLV